ncbi:hypothetical protein BKA70DRAFT_1237293 [Coprinopsis sp. MPI-PUGE-AT-0042]|nr:hypothetical protein BKA70DRAFT_1237293 [Coprinopsis sp. MPI-PUGE-AT-0042]
MTEGFGSGPEARECSGTRYMDRKRAEASRSSVARRRRQGDGIEQRWDGWGSGEVQPASVGPEMVRSSAVRGQEVLWHMTLAVIGYTALPWQCLEGSITQSGINNHHLVNIAF